MANENQTLLLTGLFQMLATIIPLFRKAGAPDVADELAAITGRADANYQEILDRATSRTTPTD